MATSITAQAALSIVLEYPAGSRRSIYHRSNYLDRNGICALTEDNLQVVISNVMANDLGGAAKTLFSIDNGLNRLCAS